MKKNLLALSLLAVTGLFAEYDNCDNCSDYCDPCCEPKPKKCIDCVCYTPPFYDLQCDWGAFVDAEFLYWYGRESDLPFAVEVTGVRMGFAQNAGIANSITTLNPTKVKSLDAKWAPGFRVGLGWNSSCDGWDVYLDWTWYRNKKTERTSVDSSYGFSSGGTSSSDFPAPGQIGLLNPWINTGVIPVFSLSDQEKFTVTFDSIKTTWRLQLNSIDLELGRKYWLSPCFNLRPYVGLRGAWTKTRFSNTGTRNPLGVATLSRKFKDRFIDRQWGVGLLAGIQPTFLLGCNVSIYGNLDGALIWGKSQSTKKESYNQSFFNGGIFVLSSFNPDNFHREFFTMVPILDVALGLRWEDTWCRDRYRTALDLGWEHHVWFDLNHRLLMNGTGSGSGGTQTSVISGFTTVDVLNTNLYYGGFVLRVRFDF